MSLNKILQFTDLMHKYRAVTRKVLIQGSDRDENDVEHSYTLAMLAWYVNDTYKLRFDISKLFKYALAHDLVEVYAGDTFFYQTDASVLSDKHEREAAAAKRLQEEFPEFPELHAMIEAYEKRDDGESRFIYALDKMEPALSIYLDGGRTWKECKITLEMLKYMKFPKVALDPTIDSIFKEFSIMLEKEEKKLFG